MLKRAKNSKSTEKLIITASSSIEDIQLPPLNLKNVKSYDGLSSSSVSPSVRYGAGGKDRDAILVASADVHAPAAAGQSLAPIPAPRRSSAFEMSNAKDDKDQLNRQMKQERSPSNIDEHDGNQSSTYDESESIPLVEAPKRNRPKSARPKRLTTSNDGNNIRQLPSIVFENENLSQSSDGQSKRSSDTREKRDFRSQYRNNDSQSDGQSADERNDYEMVEITSTSKDNGRENPAYEDDDDDDDGSGGRGVGGERVQETCVDSAKELINSTRTVDKHLKSKKKTKKRHRKSKKHEEQQIEAQDVAEQRTNVRETSDFTTIIGEYGMRDKMFSISRWQLFILQILFSTKPVRCYLIIW